MRRILSGVAAATMMVVGAPVAHAQVDTAAAVDTQTEIQNLAAEIEQAITEALAELPPNATEEEKRQAVRLAVLEAIEGHSASVALAALTLTIANGTFAGDPVVVSMLTTMQSDIVSFYIVGPGGGVGGAPGGGTIITDAEFEYIAPETD